MIGIFKRLFIPRKILIITEAGVNNYPFSPVRQLSFLAFCLLIVALLSYTVGLSVAHKELITVKDEQIFLANLAQKESEEKLFLMQDDLLKLKDRQDDLSKYDNFVINQYVKRIDEQKQNRDRKYELIDNELKERVVFLEKRVAELERYRNHVVNTVHNNADDTIEHFKNVLEMTGLKIEDFTISEEINNFESLSDAEHDDNLKGDENAKSKNLNRNNLSAQKVYYDRDGNIGGPYIPVDFDSDIEIEEWQAARKLDILLKMDKFVKQIPIQNPMMESYYTSPFGVRIDPFKKRPAKHHGLDLVGPINAEVFATAPGKVTYAGSKGSYGRIVIIKHDNNFSTRYAHLNKILVKRGETVTAGQAIGTQGNTGRSTGDHLHYEVRHNKKPLDPELFIEAGRYVFKE